MNEIITRSIRENEVRWLAQIPDELLSSEEIDIKNWVVGYALEFGKTPSVKRLMDKFTDFVPYEFISTKFEEKPPPLGDVFDQTIKRRLFVSTELAIEEIKAMMKTHKEVPLDEFEKLLELHALSTGVYKFSTFDRDEYFRRKTINIPFSLINKSIGGLANGDFLLMIGRLGSGKSTLIQFVAERMWQQDMKILFVSAEMLAVDTFARIDAMIGKFNPLELRTGKTKELTKTLSGISIEAKKGKGEIIIPKSRLLSPAQISSFAKNMRADVIIVDGAYLLRPSSGKFTSKWEKVSTVSNELKQIALDLQVPIIGTAQIKRGASGKEGYDPEDIALSDSLGQDADFVIAAWPNPVIKGRLELQLIKNRYGEKCAMQIFVDFDKMQIIDETKKAHEKAKTAEPISLKEWIES